MLTGGPCGSPDSSDPMVDGVRHPLDSGCAGYILYSAYPVLMGRCGFREILCKAAVAVRRAVLPWVLLYAGLCPAPYSFDLRSAYKETAFGLWGFVFIRNRRCSLVVSFGFFHEEYLIALVDFIVALRRTKGRGRRTLRSPPSPSSGLHLIHPGDPLRRGILAAAVDRDIGSLYPVQTVHPHFDVLFGCIVFGLRSFAFQ